VDDARALRRALHSVPSDGVSLAPKTRTPVLVGNLRSEILVVQSAQNRHRQRETHSLDGTRDRRVLVQGQVRTSLVVIFLVGIEQMAQMPFAEHNNMVKTIPSDRTDQPLRISVLPWRPW
jgi:hypothetical protein